MGFGSDERGAAEHENTRRVLVFGRGWAEEAPNTQNVPMGRVLCVRVKENGPTAKTRPYGQVFAIGMRGEGREMTPTQKTRVFHVGSQFPGCPI